MSDKMSPGVGLGDELDYSRVSDIQVIELSLF